jgi:hypothetical protein
MTNQVVRTAQYHEQRKLEAIGKQLAAEKAAKQAEYDRYANRRHFDDDEMMAMCGLPPRRR